MKRGYRTLKISPLICMIEAKDDFVVNYNGTLYKCPGLIGAERFKVGDLRSGMNDYGKSHNLDSWKTNDECRDCEYLPMCFGGCRFMKYVRDGDMDGVDCKKTYIDATLEACIRQDIEYRTKPRN